MSKCPVFGIADLVGRKWTIVILQEILLNGNKGFNAVSRRMKLISPKILSARLKELENSQIIEKKMTTVNGRVKPQYRLTQKGKELYSVIESLKMWNIKWPVKGLECSSRECVNCSLYNQ